MIRSGHRPLRSESAFLLVLIMFGGSIALWVGVPLAWLWIGAQVLGETESVGLSLFVMMTGVLASVGALVSLLGWLGRRHIELLELRGRRVGPTTPLEQVLIVSAAIALIGFAVWFFGFSGSPPFPGLEFTQ